MIRLFKFLVLLVARIAAKALEAGPTLNREQHNLSHQSGAAQPQIATPRFAVRPVQDSFGQINDGRRAVEIKAENPA